MGEVNMNKMAALAVVCVALGITGCGEQQQNKEPEQVAASASAAGTATPGTEEASSAEDICSGPESANRQDASSVAMHFVGLSYCWDSTTDTSMKQGVLRTEPLMSEKFAQLQQQAPERGGFQSQFLTAHKINAKTTVEVSPTPGDVDQDIDGDKSARGVSVSWHWIGDEGKRLPGGSAQVIVYLEKNESQWEVVSQQVTNVEEK